MPPAGAGLPVAAGLRRLSTAAPLTRFPDSKVHAHVRVQSSPPGFPSKEERRIHKRHVMMLIALVALVLGVMLGYYIAYTPPHKIFEQMQAWRQQIELLTGQPLPQPILNMLEQACCL